MNILITGGKGHLGSALAKHVSSQGHSVVALGKDELDVRSLHDVDKHIREPIDVVINCAGVLSIPCESDHRLAWDTNVDGAINVAFTCKRRDVRMVHVSSDYVFDGELGNYKEDEPPSPINYYGFTKAQAELATECEVGWANLLTLRAPFRYDGPWPYKKVFCDQWISGRWMSEVVPDVARAALDADLTGILHIGGPKVNVLEMARTVSPDVESCTRDCFNVIRVPRDVSLDSSRWKEYLSL